jgi:hypothetical protein
MEPDGPRWRYRVDHPPATPDRFQQHWLESFRRPAMRSLLITLRVGQERLYLHNHKLRVTGPGGKHNRNVRSCFEETAAGLFGIEPRVAAAALAALRRLRGGGGDGP